MIRKLVYVDFERPLKEMDFINSDFLSNQTQLKITLIVCKICHFEKPEKWLRFVKVFVKFCL